MYCANCGSEIKIGLNYCSRCGARAAKIETEIGRSLSENLTASLGYIGAFGLVGYIFVALVLVKNGVSGNALAAISLFYLATLFGICFMILQQLKTLPGKSKAPDFQNNFGHEQLEAADTAQLEEPKQQPISVTERTTRTLDKI